jgi:hypothetical protein
MLAGLTSCLALQLTPRHRRQKSRQTASRSLTLIAPAGAPESCAFVLDKLPIGLLLDRAGLRERRLQRWWLLGGVVGGCGLLGAG